MTRIWFVVPCHGREQLAAVCLRQLKRTCDTLNTRGFHASAVVVADDGNLDTAKALGFATVKRDNRQLGRKFNDGYQLACDPAYNPRPVDYCVPCGSDDWVDPNIFNVLPPPDSIGVFHKIAVVDENRHRICQLDVRYRGGVGIRIIPAALIAQAGYRPADEDRKRAIDTSTLRGLTRANNHTQPRLVPLDTHPFQIVDWKSTTTQLNTYDSLRSYRRAESDSPYTALEPHYPAEALAEMRAL